MYQYEPKDPKKQEKLILLSLLVGAAILLSVASIPQMIYPVLLQLPAVLLFVAVVMIAGKCLLCRYSYRVEMRSGGAAGEPMDFLITQYQGDRASVVCRISVADIEEIVRSTPQSHKQIKQMLKKGRVYNYTARLSLNDAYLVTVRDGEELLYLWILADELLLSLLNTKI